MKFGIFIGLVCLQALPAQNRSLQDASTGAALSGPILGFAFDAAIRGVRPLLGIPGAAVTGAALDLGFEIAAAASSPRQDYVLAVAAEDGSVRVARWHGSDLVVGAVEGAMAFPDGMVTSPGGRAALLYRKDSGALQIVSGLPEAPRILRRIGVSGTNPEAQPFAISDDGQSVAVSGTEGVLLFRGGAPAKVLPAAGPISALAFAPGGDDLLAAAAGGEITWIRGLSGSTAYRTLAGPAGQESAAAAVQFSRDGSRAFAAAPATGTITIWNLETESSSTVSCRCAPAALDPLSGPAVFRLTSVSGEPIWILDDRGGAARLLFVPPAQDYAAGARGNGE